MKRIAVSILLLFLGSFVFGLTGQEVLDKVEASLTGYTDQTAVTEVILGRMDKVEETRTMKLWSAGKSKRVVKFLQPSNVKDIGILVRSKDEMYIYLPAYKKVRRIQGSMKDQNFQGTDFSYREIGSFEYSDDYSSKVLKEDENTITLELTKKNSSDAHYSRIIMLVDKINFLPLKLEMYLKEELKKVLTIIESEKKGNYWVLTHIKMEDISKKHYTEIKMKDISFDTGLEKKGIFTERFLQEPAK
ncbi:MAG: outer membrane lipoprotein-sorting protein [Brevinematia bacterium]